MRFFSFIDTDKLTAPAQMALELAAAAKEAGHEAIVVGLIVSKEPPGKTELGATADASGIPFRLVQQRGQFDPGILGQLETMLRRMQPDVYQSHDLKGMALYRVARWKARAWQAFVHAGREAQGSLSRLAERNLLKRADQVIAESAEQKERALRIGVREERLLMLRRGDSADIYWKKSILSESARLAEK